MEANKDMDATEVSIYISFIVQLVFDGCYYQCREECGYTVGASNGRAET